MKLDKDERLNLLQKYNRTKDLNTRQYIVYQFIKDMFPNDKEYKQISNYIRLTQQIHKLMKGSLEPTYGMVISNEYSVLDIIKYF